MTRAYAAIIFFAIRAGTASAVDLQNDDDKRYTVKFTQNERKSETVLEPKSTRRDLFSGEADIEVVGVGNIKASGTQIVIIKNGKLTRKDRDENATTRPSDCK
jgi:hypothetical protein